MLKKILPFCLFICLALTLACNNESNDQPQAFNETAVVIPTQAEIDDNPGGGKIALQDKSVGCIKDDDDKMPVSDSSQAPEVAVVGERGLDSGAVIGSVFGDTQTDR